MSVAQNVARVHEAMRAAARRAGRDENQIALMAVSKTHPPERMLEAYAAGLRLFGENRVQEFAAKSGALGNLAGAQWHMIGHLQTNKAARAAELFSAVDSVDSLKLAERLDSAARGLGRKLPVLIEINIGDETAKSGIAPDSPELETLLAEAEKFEHLEFRGLMTIPPFTADPQQARPYFRKLSTLRDRMAARKPVHIGLETLSMGMSHDFEVAIEEGSTCVRVGTAIFGERLRP
ncbi:MAG TPA: YggS family pyridoxal phosphate-dependent enzyme [Terriglobales bacterium]|nr:YggS family pyridoxal phosphate-dependent enzyme [Terriglobales bacterium]